MTIRRFAAILTVAVATLALVGSALAERPAGRGAGRGHHRVQGPEHGPRLERLIRHLDLSEDQREAIAGIVAEGREKHVETRKEMLRLRHRLEGEMLGDDPDAQELLELVEQVGALRTTLQQQRLRTLLAVREQLTPEQRDRMLLMRGGRHGHAGRGHHLGHGPAWGPGGGRGCWRAWSGDED